MNEAHVSVERFNFCWPLSHVTGFPYRRVLSVSKTTVKSSNHSCFMGLFDSIRFLAETAGSPLFPRNPLITCCEYEPRKHFNILANIGYIFSAFLWDEKSRLFHVRAISGLIISSNPACYLPVYASQDMLPYTTQDSVHDCWLGFVTVVISGHLYPLNFQGAITPYPLSFQKEGEKQGYVRLVLTQEWVLAK